MKFPNNNKVIINKLTIKSIKANKLRNTFLIVAIALTTVLFTSLFTIGMGMVNSMEQQTMRQAGGCAHGTFKYLTKEEFDKIRNHPLIDKLGYSIMVNMAENKELLKRHTEIRYATDTQAKMYFSTPTKGKMPQKENEIATDTKVLDLLGVQHQIGQKVKLEYFIGEKKLSQEFILSGYWKTDDISSASMVFVSHKFIENNIKGFIQSVDKNPSGTGLIFADVMFKNSRHIEKNMQTVLKDSGYSTDKNSPNGISIGINWAYMSTHFTLDITTVTAILGAIILIIVTGYLIIYNIFQISVIKNIRFYGLLKTIGTTPKQIKKLVRKQALLLSALGIPTGLVIGYLIGNIVLPIIMKTTTIKSSYISFNPIIFIGATIFSLITVFISCSKPGKIASKVSPVEATRYIDVPIKGKTRKKSLNGGKVHNMALSNILRNKKKTFLVVISMSLSLILLNCVFTFTNSFSMDKYLKRDVVADFIAGNANYFNVTKGFNSDSDVISEKMINDIKELEGIKNGGRIYYNIKRSTAIINNKEIDMQVYGIEDFPLSQLNIFEGKLDLEKLKTGKYIIEAVDSDDYGNIEHEKSKCKIGDKLIVKFGNGSIKEYVVMAKAELKHNMSVRYYNMDGCVVYLPSKEYIKEIKEPLTMSYIFNVDDKYRVKIEDFLKNYTNNIECEMNYESKQKYIDGFKSFQHMFLLVGGILSFIIGIIGVLNFINAIITSIIARQREFAMIQSIGMTNKQLNKMVILEGFFYALGTIIISMILGSLTSVFIVKPISEGIWFCSYKFTLLPILIISLILVLVSMIIPLISYTNINKQTIVERLRLAE